MWPTAFKGFSRGAVVKNPPAKTGDARDSSSIPGSGRSSGNGNPFQYSCLENSMDRGAWWAIVHGITKEWDTTEWLSTAHSIQTPGYEVCVACAPCLQTIILEISTHPHAPQSPNTRNPECDGQFYTSTCLGCCTQSLNQTLFWCCWGGIK